jgi:uncharacterized protein with PQ loop repeat
MTTKPKHNQKIENLALVAGIAQPLLTLPQIYAIFSNQSAQDVSIFTWLGYLIFGIIFLVYGLTFKLKPIIISQIIWITMQTIVIIGILIY